MIRLVFTYLSDEIEIIAYSFLCAFEYFHYLHKIVFISCPKWQHSVSMNKDHIQFLYKDAIGLILGYQQERQREAFDHKKLRILKCSCRQVVNNLPDTLFKYLRFHSNVCKNILTPGNTLKIRGFQIPLSHNIAHSISEDMVTITIEL